MIEGSKQQQLTFEKGITNVPSDLLCSDNALEESVGMIYDNGEHRVIQNPKEYITSAWNTEGTQMDVPVILYIHKFNDEERYIGYREMVQYGHTLYPLCWCTKDGTKLIYQADFQYEGSIYYTKEIKITSIGKTLVFSNADNIYRFLWKGDVYDGCKSIPDLQFKAHIYVKDSIIGPVEFASCSGDGAEIITGVHDNYYDIDKSKQDVYNDLVVGLYAKNKRTISQKKCFCLPFFIRAALELYDGTYYYVTNPILLFPSVTRTSIMSNDWSGTGASDSFSLRTYYGHMYVSQLTDYADFTDIVKDVVLLASEGIEIYDTLSDQETGADSGTDVIDFDYVASTSEGSDISVYGEYNDFAAGIHVLKNRDKMDIVNDLKSTSRFYRICSLGLSPVDNIDSATKIETHTLENITTQEMLENDDYFSRSALYPSFLYSYNSRLNISNVSRGFFEGFGNFMPFDDTTNLNSYNFYVRIKLDDGRSVWVSHHEVTRQKQGFYFYYPDSRADHVVIYNGDTCVLDKRLEEHSGLNGAFYFAGLPNIDYTDETSVIPSIDPRNLINNNATERLANYIIQSVVNNPWVFQAEGYFKVGTGKIIGMSTITQALSEGQYGQYPLLVFSESGIWSLSVADTGYYMAIHPMSREVCNNANSITQTDGAVFFSSEKGLMVVVGGDVRCVSEQLSGRNADFTGEISMGNFRDYLKDCFIAYDYRDSLLWIFNNSRQQNNKYCYVYSIKSGTFGKFSFVAPITNVVNNYPDYLLQTGSRVYSLTERVNINLDPDEYDGLIITRPMKLENGLALKSLMQVRHIKQMQGDMTLRIFASNNTDHWVELHSLRGTPWKYYRFRYDFTSLAATDRFAGSVVITQERRTDKLL